MKKRWMFIMILMILILSIWLPNLSTDDNTGAELQSPLVDVEDEIVVAGIYRNGSASQFIEEGINTADELESAGVTDFIFMDGKRNEALYLKSVEAMIDEEVDGIILSQPFEGQITIIDNLLRDAGIPYVITNGSADQENSMVSTSTVGIDDYAAGHMTGDWIANYTIKNGLIDAETVGLLYINQENLPNMTRRREGQRDRFNEMIPYFDMNNVYETDFNGTIDDGLKKTTGVVVNALDISYWVVLATSDEGAIGAVRALEQLGMDSKSVVTSIGGNLAVNEFRKEYSALKGAGYFASAKVGNEAAKVLLSMILDKGDIISTTFNTVIITRDNYLEYVED